MTTLDTSQQTALEQPVVRMVYFAYFAFASEDVRVSTLNQTMTWGGYTWTGLGALAGIAEVETSDDIESKSLQFTLNLAAPGLISLSVVDVSEYRGKDAYLYACPLDENYKLVGTPVICWKGIMDTISLSVSPDGTGAILLKCETSAYGLKRRPTLRLNAAQHKVKYPEDTGLDYLEDLIANPQLWVSKKFQSI